MPIDRRLQAKKRKQAHAAPDQTYITSLTKAAGNVEHVGHYDPKKNPADVKIDRARIEYWVSKGAQLSPTVTSLLKKYKKYEDSHSDRIQRTKDLQAAESAALSDEDAQRGTLVTSVFDAAAATDKVLRKQLRGFELTLARRLKRWERLARAAERIGE